MVTVLPHFKLAWGGTLGVPAVEVWTNSLGWQAQTAGIYDTLANDPEGIDNALAAAATHIKNWFQMNNGGVSNGPESNISPVAHLTWVKLNPIGADGKYTGPSHTLLVNPEVQGGGNSGGQGQVVPWQNSVAITMRTAINRGRGSKGRIYPPMSTLLPAGTSPYISDAMAASCGHAFVGLINQLNSSMFTDGTPGGRICIVSTSPASGPHAGAAPLLTPVTSIEVDQVPDVQRRRVNRVPRKIMESDPVTGVSIG